MRDFQLLKSMVLDGIELTYGKMTLCNLEHYGRFKGLKKWQIFCDDRKNPYYYVYKDLDDALMKFFELKMKIGTRVR
jgi:hypothetical protein